MPTVQSTYGDAQAQGVPGMIADMIPATMISRTCEDAAGIGFGLAVAQGTDENGCSAFSSGDTAIMGISVRERSVSAGQDKFQQYESVRIMTKGAIFVTASVAVNPGDPVYVIPATGAFAKTSASSAVLIAGARWDTKTTTTNQLAKVRLG